MTDHHDPENPNHDPAEPVDCSEEAARRAGAKQSSLNTDDHDAKPDVDKDDISEADLDEALEDSMDGSDPPASVQP